MNQNDDNEAFDAEVQPRAEVIALVRYTVTPEDIAKTTANFAALTADTTEGYEKVRRAIAYCRTTRVEVEAQRKAKKAGALEFGRKVDSGARALVALIEPIEADLQAKKDVVDQERDRIKREAEAAEKAALEAKIRAERQAEEARLRAEHEAEEKRLAAQRAEIEREQATLAEAKLQQEASVRAENERLAAERQRLDDEQTAERRRLEAERAKLEQAKRDIEADRARQERVEFERQTAARLKREAVEQAERDRVAAEERRVAEAERQAELARRLAALRPDAEKLQAFAADINTLTPPDVQSAEARQALAATLSILAGIVKTLESFGAESIATAAE